MKPTDPILPDEPTPQEPAVMTWVITAPEPMPDFSGILNEPRPSPWFDATKKKRWTRKGK